MENALGEATIKHARISVTQGDITAQPTDAIVNAANSSLMGGGGVDGAIHRVGGTAILEDCKQIVARHGRLPTGKAVITTGGNLPAKYVIHTVGPIWHGGSQNEADLLAGAYRESLKCASENSLTSIAFPSISTGAYRYPITEAAEIAMKTVVSFVTEGDTSLKEVVFVLFNAAAYEAYVSALGKVAG